MKKIISITTAALLFVCLSTASALAGDARRHTIEGFMLGAGAAILGAAIINEINQNSHHPTNYTRPDRYGYDGHHQNRHKYVHQNRYTHQNRHHKDFRSHGPGGYWVIKKIWVQPVYEKRWNPGHYNRSNKWVGGRHERSLVKGGCWEKKRVWVRY